MEIFPIGMQTKIDCTLLQIIKGKLMFPLVKKIIDGIPLVLIMIDCAASGNRPNMGSSTITTPSYNIRRSYGNKSRPNRTGEASTGAGNAINACLTQNKFKNKSANLDLTSRDRATKGIRKEDLGQPQFSSIASYQNNSKMEFTHAV